MPAIHTAQTAITLKDNKVFKRLLHHVKKTECKAVMNQGFDFTGLRTEEIIAELRKVAPNRTYVFIDSVKGNYTIWKPCCESPETINKRDLNDMMEDPDFLENVFAYYSPKDIRGTDFRLPPGYAIALISDKCSTQDIVQLCGRMRQSGTTQSIQEIVISEATGNKIRENYDIEKVTYAHLVDDVAGQTAPAYASKNLKSASEEFRRIVKMGTRRLIAPSRKYMDDSDCWSVQTLVKRLIDSTMLKAFSDVAESEKTGWIYDSKAVDFESDFLPTTMEDIQDNFQKVFNRAIEQVEQLEEISKQLQDQSLSLSALSLSVLSLFQPDVTDWTNSRIEDIQEHIAEMRKNLTEAKVRFNSRIRDEERTVFPDRVPSMSGGMPVTQTQIQVQVQQQQQVQQLQQQQLHRIGNIGGIARKYPEWSWSCVPVYHFLSYGYQNGIQYNENSSPMASEEEFMEMQKFWNTVGKGLKISQDFGNIFFELNGMHGDMKNARLYLDAQKNVTIINRQDYNKHVFKEASSGRTTGVYTIIDPSIHDGVSYLVNVAGSNSPDFDDPEIILRMALAKVFLGITQFTDDKEGMLSDWFGKLDPVCRSGLLTFSNRFGSEEQVNLLKRLLKI